MISKLVLYITCFLFICCGSAAASQICLPPDTAKSGCKGKSASYENTICLEDYFVNMTYLESATKAIDSARRMQEDGEIDDCHIVAHMVGKANLIKYGYDLGKALGTCSTSCLQGCIHGAVQTYVSEKVDVTRLKEELSSICEGLDKHSPVYGQCIHGLGHGFLTGDYMSITEAIAACESLDSADSHRCLGGVFMENMQKNLLLPESEFRARLPQTCTIIEKMNRPSLTRACYSDMGEGIMFYTAHNLGQSLEYCNLVSNNYDNITACKKGARTEARIGLLGSSQQPH